jgi:glyoxylase-like metal-dependent hydrolase (beta-lactamase superfamily II)
VATSPVYLTTTTVVAGNGGGCLLIDPALTPAELASLGEWLTARGLHPVAAWSTHAHWDHVLWSSALDGRGALDSTALEPAVTGSGTGQPGGGSVPRYATARAAAACARDRAAMTAELLAESEGHELALFAQVTPLPGPGTAIAWDGPPALVVAHDAHAPGHGALYLPHAGVLVAGDMLSDIEIPLPGLPGEHPPDAGDPFGDYRAGLGLLAAAGARGLRHVVPGHGHVGDTAEFRRRVAADFGYLDRVETGRDPADPRLDGAPARWLRDRHADLARLAQRALAEGNQP